MAERLAGTIERINGSLIIGKFKDQPKMGDLIEVGDLKLMGEIVRLSEGTAYIQCYESTSGLKPGEPVIDIGTPLVAELGPGLMGQIIDGVARSETELWDLTGPFISRGANIPPLNREKVWKFEPTAKVGDKVSSGDFIGTFRRQRPLYTGSWFRRTRREPSRASMQASTRYWTQSVSWRPPTETLTSK